MKGTDLTGAQIAHAQQFIAERCRLSATHLDRRMVEIPMADLARAIAWYGALRYMAGRDGTGGTLERPGPLVTTAPPDVEGSKR